MLPIHFAPMQGYTDAPYRAAHAAIFGGIDAYYTPFIRIERGTFRTRDLRNVDGSANAGFRLIPQIIASNADDTKRLVELVAEKGYSEVDINMGCPFPMITSKHKGSGILPHPSLVEEVLAAATSFGNMRVSLKMRLGHESANDCLVLLPIISSYKLQHVTMHPRIGKQQYSGDFDMETFTTFYNGCAHPVIYNGGIGTPAEIERIALQFPRIVAVMVGSGLLTNPAMALEYKNGAALERDDYMNRVRQFHQQLLTHYEATLYGDKQILEKMKPFWEYLLPDGSRKCKKRIAKTTSLNNYKISVDEMLRD